jgi:hypothetical protein
MNGVQKSQQLYKVSPPLWRQAHKTVDPPHLKLTLSRNPKRDRNSGHDTTLEQRACHAMDFSRCLHPKALIWEAPHTGKGPEIGISLKLPNGVQSTGFDECDMLMIVIRGSGFSPSLAYCDLRCFAKANLRPLSIGDMYQSHIFTRIGLAQCNDQPSRYYDKTVSNPSHWWIIPG